MWRMPSLPILIGCHWNPRRAISFGDQVCVTYRTFKFGTVCLVGHHDMESDKLVLESNSPTALEYGRLQLMQR